MCGRETPELAAAAVEGGADLIELGFPFSDPLADGPVVRARGRASARATACARASASTCLARTRALVDVPLVPMTYAVAARGLRLGALRRRRPRGRRDDR